MHIILQLYMHTLMVHINAATPSGKQHTIRLSSDNPKWFGGMVSGIACVRAIMLVSLYVVNKHTSESSFCADGWGWAT